MTSEDRIHQLEERLGQLTAQIAGVIPVRLADGGRGDAEKNRLIRGQVIGAVAGGTHFLIDNVWVLAGGLDPSGGNPAAAIVVANIYGQTFADNELVTAVYSPGVTLNPPADWEALKKGVGSSSSLLQFAEVYSTITAQSVWGTPGTGTVKFKLDDGTPDGAAPVAVANRYKHTFAVGDTVLCDRAFTPPRVVADKGGGASDVELIPFIFHLDTGSTLAATRVAAGPTIRPLQLTVTRCAKNVDGDLAPTAETLTVEYRDGTALPPLPAGFVYAGEALRIGAAVPVILVIYCQEWET